MEVLSHALGRGGRRLAFASGERGNAQRDNAERDNGRRGNAER
jgi:hypothetical protein